MTTVEELQRVLSVLVTVVKQLTTSYQTSFRTIINVFVSWPKLFIHIHLEY